MLFQYTVDPSSSFVAWYFSIGNNIQKINTLNILPTLGFRNKNVKNAMEKRHPNKTQHAHKRSD